MLRLFALLMFMFGSRVMAQETPASPTLMTMGPIDGESDQKSSIITVRYDSKPGFPKPKVEAMGSFIQVTLPSTMVPKPGQFVEANSPYIRKFAAFQLDEQTAGLRLFVTKEASHLVGAVTADILENRVVIMLDHVEAEKQLLAHFDGVPVTGGPTAEEVVKKTEVRSDIPDPAKTQAAPKEVTAKPEVAAAANAAAAPAWSDGLQDKLVLVTGFLAVMLVLMIGLKSWRRMMTKKWPGAPVEDYSLKTLATHAVGPKQKLTVVQVGQEQILLGVSPDNINFLTSLKKPNETPPRVAIDPALFQKQALPKEAQVRRSGPVLDDVAPRPAPRQQRPTQRSELPEPGSAISYGISDQGIKNMKNQPRQSEEPSSVDDVTRMIRKKLRDLPKV